MKDEKLSVIGILLTMIAACIGTFMGFHVPLYFTELVIMPFTSDWDIRPEHQNLLAIDLILFMSMTTIVIGITFGIVANKLLSKTKSQKEVLNGGDVEKVRKELSIIQIIWPSVIANIGAFVVFDIPLVWVGLIHTPLQIVLIFLILPITSTMAGVIFVRAHYYSSKTNPKNEYKISQNIRYK
jgi:Na+-driven multidrug efflux pump